jgi:Dyp-type peroxidase family
MPNLSQRKPIVEAEQEHQRLLGDLQCNILSSHRCSNTHYFFLRFSRENVQQARAVLRELALGGAEGLPDGLGLSSELRSRANHRVRERAAWAAKALRGGSRAYWTNLLLTGTCYADFLANFSTPPDSAFNHGMVGRDDISESAHKLNDPPLAKRGEPPHALFTVGHDENDVKWQAVREQILMYLRARGVQVREEAGYVLRHPEEKYPIEPFGYRDSISQPLFFESDLQWRAKLEGAAASVEGGEWSSLAPLSTVLVVDPNGDGEESCGSYVVYRKVKQKVGLFYTQARELADATARPERQLTRDEAADRLIGRHVDGRPLDPAPNLNDYKYSTNSACPMSAHARKVNPREPWSRGKRIVRRSTVFGPRLKRGSDGRPHFECNFPVKENGEPFDEDKEAGVGLMFFCCQADIEKQFEAIQSEWANDTRGGADTVIAQMPPGETQRVGLNNSGLNHPYQSVVQLLDGAYFFSPSLSFFSKL